ncbi:MAG TPA: hypothetical protein PLP16_05265 [Smithellaceae bacterium]|nr:hypothetical protein [Smithellaceae bacterium]
MMTKPWHKFYDYNVPLTIRYPRNPAHKIFLMTAGIHPDKICTRFSDRI